MKKLLILVAICGLSATACKKERTCKCDGGVNIDLPKAKKSDQKKACEVYELGGISCKLD